MTKKILFAALIALCMILAASVIATAHSEAVYADVGENTKATADETATVHQVDISDTGFNPDEITIEAGDSVNWTNQTSHTVILEEGKGQCIYIPLVAKLSQNTSSLITPGFTSIQTNGVSILPGESYTRVFPEVGSNNFFILGHCYQPGVVTVEPRKDFSLTAVPDHASIYAGDTVTYTIELASQNGFIGPVTLSVDGLPAGALGNFIPNPATPPITSTLAIETNTETPAGDHFLEIIGTSGDITHTTQVTLTVIALPDLEVRTIILDPNPAAQYDPVNLTTEIYNLGLGDADAFTVEWKLFPLGEITPIDSGSWEVSGLNSGEFISLNTTLIATLPGPFTIQVTADPNSDLPDLNPSNNTKEAELGVTGRIDFSGSIAADKTWAYATYVLTSNVDISSGVTLTVRSRAVIKPLDAGTGMQVYGTLQATGNDTTPVVFTSYKDDSYGVDTKQYGVEDTPAPGDWSSIFILTGGSANLSHTVVRYGSVNIQNQGGVVSLDATTVEYAAGNGINSDADCEINILNSLVQTNGRHGLYCVLSGSAAPVIMNTGFHYNTNFAVYFNLTGDLNLDGAGLSGNTAENNGTNGLRLVGTLTGSSTLSGDLGFAYVLEESADRIGSIYIPAGSTLGIQPGAVLKGTGSSYWYGKGTGLEVEGILTAVGTTEDPIVFTSINDDNYAGDTNNNGEWNVAWTRRLDTPGSLPMEDPQPLNRCSSAILVEMYMDNLRKAFEMLEALSHYRTVRSNMAAGVVFAAITMGSLRFRTA